MTILEEIDKEWNSDIKHIIYIQEPFKNYKTGKLKTHRKTIKTSSAISQNTLEQ